MTRESFPVVNSNPLLCFVGSMELISTALVVTCKPFEVNAPNQIPPTNICSIPEPRGYWNEGCVGQVLKPVPSWPKFVIVIAILPTLVYFVLSSPAVLLKCCDSDVASGRNKGRAKITAKRDLLNVCIIEDLTTTDLLNLCVFR